MFMIKCVVTLTFDLSSPKSNLWVSVNVWRISLEASSRSRVHRTGTDVLRTWSLRPLDERCWHMPPCRPPGGAACQELGLMGGEPVQEVSRVGEDHDGRAGGIWGGAPRGTGRTLPPLKLETLSLLLRPQSSSTQREKPDFKRRSKRGGNPQKIFCVWEQNVSCCTNTESEQEDVTKEEKTRAAWLFDFMKPGGSDVSWATVSAEDPEQLKTQSSWRPRAAEDPESGLCSCFPWSHRPCGQHEPAVIKAADGRSSDQSRRGTQICWSEADREHLTLHLHAPLPGRCLQRLLQVSTMYSTSIFAALNKTLDQRMIKYLVCCFVICEVIMSIYHLLAKKSKRPDLNVFWSKFDLSLVKS